MIVIKIHLKTLDQSEIMKVFLMLELVISGISQEIPSLKGQSFSISRQAAALTMTSMTLLSTSILLSNKHHYHLFQMNGEIAMVNGAWIRKFRSMLTKMKLKKTSPEISSFFSSLESTNWLVKNLLIGAYVCNLMEYKRQRMRVIFQMDR